MQKFGRNYILYIQLTNGNILQTNFGGAGLANFSALDNNQVLVVQPPFTIEFDITRNTYTSANVASIKIFNLSATNRNNIRFNIADMQMGIFRSIQLQAGYGANANILPIIFTGNITQAYSSREGVNWVTSIECFDGGFAFSNGFTSQSFTKNTDNRQNIISLVNSLPGIAPGAIGNSYNGNLSRGNSVVGNTTDIIRDMTNGGFFIDNGQGHALAENEFIDDSQAVVINSETGLLNTPIRETTFLDFDILFEPNIKPGRVIQLQSATDPSFNGLKKVVGVKHRGVISPAVCGDAITSIRTYYNQTLLPVAIT